MTPDEIMSGLNHLRREAQRLFPDSVFAIALGIPVDDNKDRSYVGANMSDRDAVEFLRESADSLERERGL